jgi:hypothetical protein
MSGIFRVFVREYRIFIIVPSYATHIQTHKYICIYRLSQEKSARPRENVSCVKVHRYNSKHLYPKLNRYGDNGQRKV